MKDTYKFLASVLVVAGMVIFCGCESTSVSEIEDLQMVSIFNKGDQLSQTMEYIQSRQRYDMNEFRNKVNSGLNRWISDVDASDSWKLAAAAATLPESLKESTAFSHLGDKAFFYNDANFVQQAFWLKEIANRVADEDHIYSHQYPFQIALSSVSDEQKEIWKESSDLLVDALKVLHPDLETESGGNQTRPPVVQLAVAMKLFDWVVRNIQLTEADPWLPQEQLADTALATEIPDNAWPASVGASGPGYRSFPWQVLTYGKGDWLARAEIFAMLCNQLDLPCAILAVPAEAGSLRPYREWLPAVLIDGEFFLFDTALGISIPGEKPGTVATLADVVANPKLIRQLDLSVEESVDELNYWVQAEMLSNITALVVSPPEAISKRMGIMEDRLTGDARLNLTVAADQLAEQFASVKNVSDCKIWHVPFSTHEFREQVGLAVEKVMYDTDLQEKLRWLIQNEAYVDEFVAFRGAKNLYLRGTFETNRNQGQRSAIQQFFNFMYSDKEIQQIENDPSLQASLGIFRRTDQDFRQWQTALYRMKSTMGLVRADAAFYLALCHYENGYPSTALKWLERMEHFDDEQRWKVYVPYQMGRTHEATTEFDKAAATYEIDESPQQHGSLIRKRWMESLKKTVTSS